MPDLETEEFLPAEATAWLREPSAADDKYSRGVVGFVTGSEDYPGAAVLGVAGALATGIGMVRFLGDTRPTELVLNRFPEVVCRAGGVDAWVIGSGVDASTRSFELTNRILEALTSGLPCVIDAGALDLVERCVGPAVITPHAGELSRMFVEAGQEVSRDQITEQPAHWARAAAERWGVCVLLKGANTVFATPGEQRVWRLPQGSAWLSTAGTGDVLAGAVGAVVASNAGRLGHPSFALTDLAGCALAGASLHAQASQRLLAPFTASALAAGIRDVRAQLRSAG